MKTLDTKLRAIAAQGYVATHSTKRRSRYVGEDAARFSLMVSELCSILMSDRLRGWDAVKLGAITHLLDQPKRYKRHIVKLVRHTWPGTKTHLERNAPMFWAWIEEIKNG